MPGPIKALWTAGTMLGAAVIGYFGGAVVYSLAAGLLGALVAGLGLSVSGGPSALLTPLFGLLGAGYAIMWVSD